MIIRKEKLEDIKAITDVAIAAFTDHPVSRQTEHFIINALREAGDLTLSLVAEINGKIVGHIAFSPVTLSDGTADWLGLGPIAVYPELQRQGIGKALINKGLEMIKAMNAGGCVLVGDPNYYIRFGFKNNPQLIHEGIPQEFFLILPFGDHIPKGTIEFHKAYLAES